jgi:hypothetical protein
VTESFKCVKEKESLKVTIIESDSLKKSKNMIGSFESPLSLKLSLLNSELGRILNESDIYEF